MKLKLLTLVLLTSFFVKGQINVVAGGTYSENFNGLGASATATLPTDWKAQKTTNARDLALNYATAVTAVERAGGNAIATSAANGIYRFNANNVTTESALGGLSSGTASKTVAFMSYFNNNSAVGIGSFTISYDVEKYRNGTNAAGFSIELLYSTDGVNWVSCGSSFLTSFPADADNNGYTPAPGTTVSVSNTFTPSANLAQNDKFYFAWMYSVTSGTTTSNAQALGFDNVSISPIAASACSTPTSQASAILTSNTTTSGLDVAWTPGATANGTLVVIRPATSSAAVPVNGTNYTPNTAWASAAQIDVNNRVVYRSNGSSVTGITGLTPGTQYVVTVYAYNGSGTNICYNTSSPESYSFYTLATEATAHAASFSCTSVSTSQINLTFSAANTIGGNGYIILYREAAAPTGVPTDGALHAAGTIFGDATVHGYTSNVGTTTTYNVTGLNGGTTYYFSLVPYSAYLSVPETLNYRTAATIPVTTCSTTIAPEMNVRGVVGSNPSIADGDTTPQGTDNTLFATVVVGNNQAKNFRIENTGNAVLNITSISMVGGNPGDFAFSGITLPTTIAAGSSLDFTVTFTPTASGIRNTTLTIANNDANENPYNFLIQGNGTIVASVDINVKGNGQTIPDNSIYPMGTNWTSFGAVTVGGSITRTFTIENLGSTALSLTGTPYVQITGPHAALFTVTVQPSSNSISGGASLTFDITFNPNTPGAKNATVTIPSNDPDENPYNFNINGTAKGINNIYVYGNGNDVVKGSTTTAVSNLTHFGSVAVTTGVKQNTFVITNLSGITTYLSNVTISGADASMFSVVAQPTNNGLGTGNSTSFTINFTPSSTGTKNATITFNTYTDAARTVPEPIDPVYTFAISGNGIVYTPCSNGLSQVIAQQDFEVAPATPVWTYTHTTNGTVNITGGTYDNGSGPKNAFIGARSFQMAGIGTVASGNAVESTVINLAGVDVSQYSVVNLSLKVGAFRTGTTQGLDINEFVQVETSIDGGVNWSTESVLRAYSNSRWDFNATGVFNAYYTGTNNGATIDTRNGGAELANGIATYNVKNLPASTNLLIRITLAVDRSDEIWAIDDVKLEGQIPVTATWDGATWTPSAPNASTKAIFDGDYNTASHGNVQACECLIKSGRTVQVTSGNYLEIQSNVTNNGTLSISNNGSLVQVNDDAVNTGNLSYERIAALRKSDYVYWSSPVQGFNVNAISPSTPSYFIWKWSTTTPNTNGGLGTWIAGAGSTMGAGEGYIVRGPNTFNDATAQNLTATFNGGTQNNGVITVPIYRGAMTASTLGTYTSANGIPFTVNDDNWNLVGNPYPSAIRALDFINANTTIEGAVRIWTHGVLPAAIINPFYGSYQYNYSAGDYITHNGTGTVSGPAGFNGYIAGGQGFFVLMNEGTAATSSVVFNNTMRSRTYDNSQFYRNAQLTDDLGEKGRIWLDIVNSQNFSVRTLIGYLEGATTEKDRVFDAIASRVSEMNIYTTLGDDYLAIQGRPLPFSTSDTVPVGVNIPTAGTYSLAIAAVDGFMANNQKIYIEDKLLQLTHDLTEAPYQFSATAGTDNQRFVLRYENTVLGNEDFTAQGITVAVSETTLFIHASQTIAKVEVFDMLGRTILASSNCSSPDVQLAKHNSNSQAAIVRVTYDDGTVAVKKIIL